MARPADYTTEYVPANQLPKTDRFVLGYAPAWVAPWNPTGAKIIKWQGAFYIETQEAMMVAPTMWRDLPDAPKERR